MVDQARFRILKPPVPTTSFLMGAWSDPIIERLYLSLLAPKLVNIQAEYSVKEQKDVIVTVGLVCHTSN